MSSFRTCDFEPQHRVEAWSELIWAALGRLQTETAAAADFTGQVRFGDVAGLKLCRAAIQTPHRVARTPELIRRDDRGVLKVVFQLQGCAVIEQSGKQLVLNPGEWTIYDASKPYVVVNPGAVEFLALLVPRDRLIKAHGDVSRFTLVRASATAGLGRLICAYLSVLLDDLSESELDSQRQLVHSALELLHLAVAEHLTAAQAPSPCVVSKERITAFITRHVRDPDLSIDILAQVMHCSKRHLHKIFNQGGETISEFLWNTRLERCRMDLGNPELQHKSITLIAFSWGFNNAAHFSRCFKERFGVSPSGYRLSSAGRVRASSGRAALREALCAASDIRDGASTPRG